MPGDFPAEQLAAIDPLTTLSGSRFARIRRRIGVSLRNSQWPMRALAYKAAGPSRWQASRSCATSVYTAALGRI
jgi:hypothetical protein